MRLGSTAVTRFIPTSTVVTLYVAMLLVPLLGLGCHSSKAGLIALIPRTTGTRLLEQEHQGAEIAAARFGTRIYYNAPDREDDIEGQISFVDRVSPARFSGLILSPSHALALITPVRRALDRGVPIVILGSPLPLPPRDRLHYVLNDEDVGGKLAAQRVALLTHGHGTVLVLGENPDIYGIMTRVRSLETALSQHSPDVRVIKMQGTFNTLREQQTAERALKDNPDVKVIVALMWSSARGAISVIQDSARHSAMKVIAFDPDEFPISYSSDIPSLDSVVVEDTRIMGRKAVEIIQQEVEHAPAPSVVIVKPVLITRDNHDDPSVQALIDFGRTSYKWDRSRVP